MAYDCSDGYLALRDAWSAEHSGGKRQVLCRRHFVTSYGHAADQQRLARGSQAYQPRARSLIECLEQMAGQGSPSCVKLHVFSNPTATLCRILNVRKHGRSNLQSHMHCYMSLFRHATENPFATTSTNIGNLRYCTSRDSSQHVRHRETDYWLSPHQPLTVLLTAPSRRSAAKQCSHVPCVPVLHHFLLPVHGYHQPYGKSDVPSETRQHLERKVRQREAIGALYTGRTTTRLNTTTEEVSKYTSEQARILPTTAHACLLYTPIT